MPSPPISPSVPFRPSLQPPPTSLFLQNPSVFVFQPGLFAQEIVYIGSIQEGTERHSGQLRVWANEKKKRLKEVSNSKTAKAGKKQKSAVLLTSNQPSISVQS